MEPKTHFGVKNTKILLALVLLVGVSLLTGLMLQFGAQKYAASLQQNRIRAIVTDVEAQYQQDRWQENKLKEIGQKSLDSRLILKIKDIDGGLEPYFLTETDIVTLNHVYGLLLMVLVTFLVLLIYMYWLKRNSLLRDLAKLNQGAKKIVNNQPVTDQLFVSGSREITEVFTSINQIAEQMAEQEREKGRITDDLAHELRTPLTTLQANLEMMAEGMVEPSPERLHSCHEELLRIIRLVGELEQLNKYEIAPMKLSLEEFDLGELLQNIFLNFEGVFRQKGVQLHFQGGTELMTGDKDKLSQLMVNLLSNSLKHTAPGGQVLIMVNDNQDFIHIVVNDNGAGIPQADLPRVFRRLYRADTSRNRATGGAGIGLTIAKAIVHAHQGSIGIVSQLGTGTEVTVVLPRQKSKG